MTYDSLDRRAQLIADLMVLDYAVVLAGLTLLAFVLLYGAWLAWDWRHGA